MASPLAAAAAGAANPFGLPGVGAATSGLGGAQGYQLLNPPVKAETSKVPTQTPVIPIPTTAATTPGAAGAATPTAGQFSFNLQTDPALQQVNALTGLSSQQAQASALQQRQQLLLQYGDPTLAAAVLGQSDPTVQAAAQNPESQLAQLDRQNMANMKGFETQLDPSLAYSGYKVGQEQQIGQNYQDALAQAAAGAQSGLGTITGNLNSTLQQDQLNQANAMEQAYANQLALILAGLGNNASAGAAAAGGGSAPPVAGPVNPGSYTTAAGYKPYLQIPRPGMPVAQ